MALDRSPELRIAVKVMVSTAWEMPFKGFSVLAVVFRAFGSVELKKNVKLFWNLATGLEVDVV